MQSELDEEELEQLFLWRQPHELEEDEDEQQSKDEEQLELDEEQLELDEEQLELDELEEQQSELEDEDEQDELELDESQHFPIFVDDRKIFISFACNFSLGIPFCSGRDGMAILFYLRFLVEFNLGTFRF